MSINTKNTNQDLANFDYISIKVASPERIKEWSRGEVKKPETMNYRTQKSEKDGLFDEKIFGPDKDYECACGKYRGIRYRGIICEKCGVELTKSVVRRERMGHIELATPIAHIWFVRSVPSRIGLVMGMGLTDLEKVIYFAGYLVTLVDEDERERILSDINSEFKEKIKAVQDEKTKEAIKAKVLEVKNEIAAIQKGVVLDEVVYHKYSTKYSTLFEAQIGSEAVYNVLKDIDLTKLQEELEKKFNESKTAEREKISKRLLTVRSMVRAKIRPEWMFLTNIPVIPPALRPMVALEGGRQATSDVNDLYRRVINRNNRLKKMQEIHAPDVILRNEKRILQEAVDALVDGSIRHGNADFAALNASRNRPLKSLADSLKGKRGLLRGNLLGKRVDYSGRSVIVIGPNLKLHQCGLPKMMALELFRPFVISDILKKELAYNTRGANRLIEDGIPEVWAILEKVIKGKFILLNRAPTLHRLGIQAFQPLLIEGNAIQVHPLVCTAFNADFDGDQMAVHLPLSEEAQTEAREIMAADKNILKPGSGDPVVAAKLLDIVLGCYWMTKDIAGEKGEGKYFASPNDAISARDFGIISYRAKIKILPTDKPKYAQFEGKPFETTVGRLLFNSKLPADYPFFNEEIEKKKLGKIIDELINKYGLASIPPIMDNIKDFGFGYTTASGITWGLDDVKEPEDKKAILDEAKKLSAQVTEQFNEGLLAENEKLQQNVKIWHEAKDKIQKIIQDQALIKDGPVYDMIVSGARGSLGQVIQMAGIKGLIANNKGETIEFPILSSYKSGLTPIEYFISTHGSRKGLTDTALNTAKAGYLTRRLFDVAQDITISEADCGTEKSILITRDSGSGIQIPLSKKIRGRILAKDLKDSSGIINFKKGHLIGKGDAKDIEKSDVAEVYVRSPLTCESVYGICGHCYGVDLGRDEMVDLGEAIGTVAAQAIGEPGTQLTMRTFHSGGVASVGGDITQGLPRVEEIFENRNPKNPAIVNEFDGEVSEITTEGKERVIKILGTGGKKKNEKEYRFIFYRIPSVKVGEQVKAGQLITDGSADIDEIFKYGGREMAQNYIISEVNKIYELQGEAVSRKHMEVIVRQMFSRSKIKTSGDTSFTVGEELEDALIFEENARVKNEGGEVATVEPLLMGISEVSLTRRSFLSSASFQHTTRMLIQNAIAGSVDRLRGLKENVIIGRLIPAGTGFKGSKKYEMIKNLQAEMAKEQAEDLARRAEIAATLEAAREIAPEEL